MSEEIKNLLKDLKIDNDYYKSQKHDYTFPDYYSLNYEDLDMLLNYITNLQEENRILRNNYNDNEQAIHKIMEENQKLKENQSGFTLEDYTRILNNYQELKETNEEHRKINGQLRKNLIVMNNKNMELVKVIDEFEQWLIKKDNNGYEKLYTEDTLIKLNELKGGKDVKD